MNRIPHSKPPHDVLYEYRKQFQHLLIEEDFLRQNPVLERMSLRSRVTANQSKTVLFAGD
jgi:hypothetical protein